jgi:hypothetical protein
MQSRLSIDTTSTDADSINNSPSPAYFINCDSPIVATSPKGDITAANIDFPGEDESDSTCSQSCLSGLYRFFTNKLAARNAAEIAPIQSPVQYKK